MFVLQLNRTNMCFRNLRFFKSSTHDGREDAESLFFLEKCDKYTVHTCTITICLSVNGNLKEICFKRMSKDIPIYFVIDIRCAPALTSAVTILTMDKSYLFQ